MTLVNFNNMIADLNFLTSVPKSKTNLCFAKGVDAISKHSAEPLHNRKPESDLHERIDRANV